MLLLGADRHYADFPALEHSVLLLPDAAPPPGALNHLQVTEANSFDHLLMSKVCVLFSFS